MIQDTISLRRLLQKWWSSKANNDAHKLGVIRDHNGDLIYAYATALGQGTNNQAGVEAAIWGLSWCLRNNIQQVILKVDSELLIRHVYREANFVADASSKVSHLFDQQQHYFHCCQFPSEVAVTVMMMTVDSGGGGCDVMLLNVSNCDD
ncbi:hypothetical protein FXO38_20219 [Capsicum annuum]|nr:hypothetical protein FXO38_20219 [Capsicum annuum]